MQLTLQKGLDLNDFQKDKRIMPGDLRSCEVKELSNYAKKYLLGNSAVSEQNIQYLVRRDSWTYKKVTHRGLSCEQQDVYLYLCQQADCNQVVLDFSFDELVQEQLCSIRGARKIISDLECMGLIRSDAIPYSHFRKIKLLNAAVSPKRRFLNLNRTYFRSGTFDNIIFRNLSAGPKSLLMYVLFYEEQKADVDGNVFSVDVMELAHELHVKRKTVREYIKALNAAFHRTLILPTESTPAEKTPSFIQIFPSAFDKRVVYGRITFSIDILKQTTLKNEAYSFQRKLNKFLSSNGCVERSVLPDKPADWRKQNRDRLIHIMYHALSDLVLPLDIVISAARKCLLLRKSLDEVSIMNFDREIRFLKDSDLGLAST